MTENKHSSPINDAAAMCFRKRLTPVTEENLKADSDLVFEMLDRKIRVHDLLDALLRSKGTMPQNVDSLLRWEAVRQRQPVKVSKIDVSGEASWQNVNFLTGLTPT